MPYAETQKWTPDELISEIQRDDPSFANHLTDPKLQHNFQSVCRVVARRGQERHPRR